MRWQSLYLAGNYRYPHFPLIYIGKQFLKIVQVFNAIHLRIGTPGGQYRANGITYTEGQVILHNALINYTCPGEEPEPKRPPLQCKLGHLIPTVPHCGVLGHDDWLAKLDISASQHIVKNGDLNLKQAELNINSEDERLSTMDVISKDVTITDEQTEHDMSCSRPADVEGKY